MLYNKIWRLNPSYESLNMIYCRFNLHNLRGGKYTIEIFIWLLLSPIMVRIDNFAPFLTALTQTNRQYLLFHWIIYCKIVATLYPIKVKDNDFFLYLIFVGKVYASNCTIDYCLLMEVPSQCFLKSSTFYMCKTY